MKCLVAQTTLLLMLGVILLTGCDSRTKQMHPENTDKVVDTPQQEQHIPQDDHVADPEVSDPEQAQLAIPENLPDAFPSNWTRENAQEWEVIIIAGSENPEYVKQLLPDDPDTVLKVFSDMTHNETTDALIAFERVYAKAVIKKFPNNLKLLLWFTVYIQVHTESPREDILEFIGVWEQVKALNDELNTPLISPYRKTPYLTHAYVFIEDYIKAYENYVEQHSRLQALYDAGLHHLTMAHGLSQYSVEWLKQKAQE